MDNQTSKVSPHNEGKGNTSEKSGKRRKAHNKNQPTNNALDMTALDDILKNEIDQLPMKTPVSVLQELLSRRGITPSYELVQIEGAIHEPTFRYRVAFNDKDVPFSAMGAGRSKKDAKHAAAKALIEKMAGATPSIESEIEMLSLTNHNGLNENNLNNNDEDKETANPIGLLQEMCMARRWPPPTYETELEVGLPHERQFTISCTVVKFREVGQGKSKKIAKRIAAHKMWTRLEETQLDQIRLSDIINEDGNEEMSQRITNILNRYADLKEKNIATLTNQHSFKVSQFHKTLKAIYGKTLLTLQTTCLYEDINFVQFLQEIATEHQFEVTYVDIEEKTYSGCYQCLVQLSTLPVAVCQGSGKSSKDAQTNAARNALEYLKIMTKK